MMSDSLDQSRDIKLSHVKKPLNAFMLYMKDMRPKVVAECTLKESAAINQILGKKVSCAYSIGTDDIFHPCNQRRTKSKKKKLLYLRFPGSKIS